MEELLQDKYSIFEDLGACQKQNVFVVLRWNQWKLHSRIRQSELYLTATTKIVCVDFYLIYFI